MRFYIAIFAALATLFAFAQADCCDQTDGLSGYCDDGTDSTPCCGNGKCNIFCCNCDDGCRKETYDGCVTTATRRYGPYSSCNYCPTLMGAVQCRSAATCQQNFDSAMASCKSRFPQSKRTINPASAITPMKRQDPNLGAEIFSMVDRDSSGNITLEDYVHFVNFKHPRTKESDLLLTDWITYFHSFDRNGDGFIHIDEHHRVEDD